MPDLLLELRSEEVPARMQAKAREDLARLLTEELAKLGLHATDVATYATPRRLALIGRGLPAATEPVREERRGPRADAPAQAIEGFLKSTGLTRDQLEEREDKKGARVLFAILERPGRPTVELLADVIPAVVRAFPWPKSMRWGADSLSPESPRWVRPLQGLVALFGDELVPCEVAGVPATAWTLGHRIHHPGPITLGGADDYEAKLRACHVILDGAERARIITERARALAAEHGLTLVEDDALAAENAGLTEWPVPLLGRFDPAYLQVPPEVIQLTMRTNQKYFSLTDGKGRLAPAFVCVANLDATDGGAAVVRGNERVLAARLADARFFWKADLKVPLEEQAAKLGGIVFHEKLGTVADKVERVARLAGWLVEEGIVKPSPLVGEGGDPPRSGGEDEGESGQPADTPSPSHASAWAPPFPTRGEGLADLATLAERAARLCKADLVTGTVGEFPELQGLVGGHLALAQGEHPAVAAAIRDHYKPVGPSDDVPTDPVTVAVSLADKLDTLAGFFIENMPPSGSRDPYALRRAALGVISLVLENHIRLPLLPTTFIAGSEVAFRRQESPIARIWPAIDRIAAFRTSLGWQQLFDPLIEAATAQANQDTAFLTIRAKAAAIDLLAFFADRLKVQQREAGVRHDLIDAVFALGGEDDLVRLLARVRALQAFMATPDGADLHAAYKRAANILKKEGWGEQNAARVERSRDTLAKEGFSTSLEASGEGASGDEGLPYAPLPEEQSLLDAIASAAPRAADAVAREEFEAAMSALASLREPIDAFFTHVTVNDPDPDKRAARLALLARFRDAVHAVADFSRIEG